MSKVVLEVKDLVKDFPNLRAVNKISFKVYEGKIVGLLGPNGAGKSTTIHMLLGITTPTAGEISFFGKNFFENRRFCLSKINYTSAYNTLQWRITVWENLKVFAMLYKVKNYENKIYELLKQFEIDDLIHRRLWDLSSGQKTRVSLAKALLNDPDLLLMDEPTASLDPDIADKTLSLIESLKKTRNLSILFTSHDMEEVTRICDEVIFLDKGNIVAQDSPMGIIKRLKKTTLEDVFLHIARRKKA